MLAPSLNVRLASIGSLLQISIRGLATDTLIVAALLAPAVIVLGKATGDYAPPTIHVADSLAFAAAIRVGWVVLLRFINESANVMVGCAVLMVSFIVLVIISCALEKLVNWQNPESILLLAPLLAAATIVVGWDRIAANLQACFRLLR